MAATKRSGQGSVQICNECGRSVAPGSGWWVNRVPDCNTPKERRRIGKPYPNGDFICAECDQECPLDDRRARE